MPATPHTPLMPHTPAPTSPARTNTPRPAQLVRLLAGLQVVLQLGLQIGLQLVGPLSAHPASAQLAAPTTPTAQPAPAPAPASPITPRGTHALIGLDLVERHVTPIALSGQDLLIRGPSLPWSSPDEDPPAQRIPLEDALLLTPLTGIPAADPSAILGPPAKPDGQPDAMVETDDGQRLWIELAPSPVDTPSGAAIAGTLPGGIDLVIPLERVRRVIFRAGSIAPPGQWPSDDLLELANGDRLLGFIEAIGAEVVIDAASGPARGQATIPAHRVARATLATQPKPRAPSIVATIDGQTIAVRHAQPEADRLALILPGDLTYAPGGASPEARLVIAPERLAGFARDSGSARLVALASLPAPSFQPGPGRRWSMPPATERIDLAVAGFVDITLPGPMAATWDLPPGAARFAATLELRGGDLGDAEVAVFTRVNAGPARRLFRQRLAVSGPPGTHPSAPLNLPLPPGATTLTIALEEAQGGPVHDTLRLVRPRLLIVEE